MAKKIYPSYNFIHNEVIQYGNMVKENKIEYDAIIALARGGSMIGTILSHFLNVPVIHVQYSSLYGQGESKYSILNKFPRLTGYQNILVVDDICDTGNTFQEVVDYLNLSCDVNTYSVYYRKMITSNHLPNHSICLDDDSWICFPWEVTQMLDDEYNGI